MKHIVIFRFLRFLIIFFSFSTLLADEGNITPYKFSFDEKGPLPNYTPPSSCTFSVTRTQKDAPMYHDLEFKYGPEGAEEILDYQTLSGGAAGGGATTNNSGSATEEAIWKDAAKCKWAQDQEDCSCETRSLSSAYMFRLYSVARTQRVHRCKRLHHPLQGQRDPYQRLCGR